LCFTWFLFKIYLTNTFFTVTNVQQLRQVQQLKVLLGKTFFYIKLM